MSATALFTRFAVIVCVCLGAGCTSVRYDVARLTDPGLVAVDAGTSAHFARVDALAGEVAALGEDVDPREARALAEAALVHAMRLAADYELTQPAIAHNVLVNLGVKPRGLCIHWTEDLLVELAALDLRTLDLYWGVAYPTRMFRLEHSSVVVTARGEPFETGLLLDGWRHSGALHFVPVARDERYAWQRLYNLITDPPPAAAPVSGPP